MDGVPSEVMFRYARLQSTVDDVHQQWQLLIRVVAEFAILVDGQEFYSEVEFPIVEFASQAIKWVRAGRGDFQYVSMESDDDPIICFNKISDNSFKISALDQNFEVKHCYDRNSLAQSIIAFVDSLQYSTKYEMAIDIKPVL
jgi:hypothetical protein